VQNLDLSFHQENDKLNYMKVIVSYNCGKLMEVMLNLSLGTEKFQRFINKLKHKFRFCDVSHCLKL